MANYIYDAFISYRHLLPDKAAAKRLHTLIETYRIPASVQKATGKKKMGKVFRDEEELPLAASLSDNIRTALESSEWLIVICSPALLASRWCMFEVEYFISLGRRDKILLVLADGTPETSFPPQLRTRLVNGQYVPTEPLAANIVADDVPSMLKRLRSEKLRILAPMLGVNFDDLKRRARQRRIRTAVTVAAAVLAAAAALGVFLAVNHARSEKLRLEAEEQQRIAEEANARAEEERRRAEEEALRKEEERLNAVNNDLGERIERASAALANGEKRMAADILLDALTLSEANGDMRRDELVGLLRRAMFIEPFTVVASLNNQNIRVNDIAVSPDGTRAIGVVNSNSVAMIDLNANEILYQVSAGNAMVSDPVFSPDGSRFMAECDYGRLAVVWNTEDGSEAFSYVSKLDRQYHIANALFWDESKTILVQDMEHFYLVSDDGTETLFYTMGDQMEGYSPDNNLLSRIAGRPLDEMLTLHNDDYTGTQLMLSADRSRVLIGGRGGETAAIVLDSSGKRVCLLGVPNDPDCFMPGCFTEKWALSPDGRTAVCISMLAFSAGWDTDTGNMILIEGFDYEGGFSYSEIAFTADSSRMAFTAANKLYVNDARTGERVIEATIDDTFYTPAVAFTEDGKYLLMTNESMFIINAETWAVELVETADLSYHYNNVIPCGDQFLITRFDGSAFFYSTPSLASTQITDRFKGRLCDSPPTFVPGTVTDLHGEHKLSDAFLRTTTLTDLSPKLAYSKDGGTVALMYADGVIELFDGHGDGTVKTLIGEFSSYVEALAMTEKVLVASDQSARLMFYDLDSLSVIKMINGGAVYSAFAFNEDGSLMMAMCMGRTRIDVYSVDTCTLLFALHAAADTFTDMGFSVNGEYAVGVRSSGGYVVGTLWQDEAALIERARQFTHTD